MSKATVTVGLLDFAPGAVLERDEGAPLLFAVWLDGDIIGAGDTQDEAEEEAAHEVIAWGERATEDDVATAAALKAQAWLAERSPAPRCGYTPCACEFCFEIAIGEPGSALCSVCEEAGCSDGDCCCLDADDLA